jgi:ubiquinone/menaquinone biosynthesis C-methylase UbiE
MRAGDFLMNDRAIDPNLHIYNSPEVAAHYAGLDYLTPCEKIMFQAFLEKGMSVLDLGVGGGRTTPFLSSLAGRYVGVDYAEEMVLSCRRKFPDLEFRTGNAADLSMFPDGSLEAVIMAFNALDYVIPDSARLSCLREIRRVLSENGTLIFSSHNPRAVLVRPAWNEHRLEAMSKNATAFAPFLYEVVFELLTWLRAAAAVATAGRYSLARLLWRLPKKAFWMGQGYLFDGAHGGLETHFGTPKQVRRELAKLGFRSLCVMGDDYPLASFEYATDWYYYAFSKVENVEEARCA